MVQRIDDSQHMDERPPPDAGDEDERLGEAIEAYLALVEQDQAPDLEEFIARYDDLKDDLRAAMEGLELVHGLVGRAGSPSSGVVPRLGIGPMAGVGPSDRRLPGRERAGPGWDGDGLRGGARRAGPAGGAESPGHARGPGLLGALTVPQRGPDRRRAASHAHRAGLRRRPGRRAVLLRHAADRGERAGSGDPAPPPRPAVGRRGQWNRPVRHAVVGRGRPCGPGLFVVQLPIRPALDPDVRGIAGTAAPESARDPARPGARLEPPGCAVVAGRPIGTQADRRVSPEPDRRFDRLVGRPAAGA